MTPRSQEWEGDQLAVSINALGEAQVTKYDLQGRLRESITSDGLQTFYSHEVNTVNQTVITVTGDTIYSKMEHTYDQAGNLISTGKYTWADGSWQWVIESREKDVRGQV